MEITLGDRTYQLVPQRIGRIRRKLGEVISLLAEAEAEAPAEIGDRLYEGLQVFIPDLDPKWKLLGYRSESAMEADQYEEEADRSPTPPQIADTIEAIFNLHGGDRLVRLLKNAIGPEAIRAFLRTEALTRLSERSPRSAPQNGPSAPTSSTPSVPTLHPVETSDSPPAAS